MPQVDLKVGGHVVYWTVGDTSRDKLRVELDAVSHVKLLPEVRSDFCALGLALKDLQDNFTQRDEYAVIRALAKESGYDVKIETKNQDKNDWREAFTVTLNKAQPGQLSFHIKDSPVYAYQHMLEHNFAGRKSELPAVNVTGVLTAMVNLCGGVRLRPSGGFYWIPKRDIDAFRAVAKAVEKSNPGGNVCFELSPVFDQEMVAAVSAAVTAEVKAAVQQCEGEFAQTGDEALGVRALRNRKDEALRMRQKVQAYESELGTVLKELTESLEKIEVRAATLELEASAKEMAEVNAEQKQ